MDKEQEPYVIPTRQQIWRMFAVFVLPVIVLGILAFTLAYFLMPPVKQAPAAAASQPAQSAPEKNNGAGGSAY
jgi:hypothetical protein